MSTLEVKVVRIEIKDHPNADKLSLAYIGGENGYISVVGKNQFNTGDLAIYIPDDSVVPPNIASILLSKNKITIKDGRIRCIKIRQVFSEGLCLIPSEWLSPENIVEGKDVKEILGIIKYEPAEQETHGIINKVSKGSNFNYKNPNFPEYWCVEHLKKYPKVLIESDEVVATIKFHGCNARFGIVKRPKTKGFLNKIIEFFLQTNEFEYLVGSHAKIKKLSDNAIKLGVHKIDTFWRASDKYKMEAITKILSYQNKNAEVIIYAEIVGPGIQKNYCYGIKEGDLEIRVFDIMINRKYLDWDEVVSICNKLNLPTVQEVYRGPYYPEIRKYADAIDEYNSKKYVREGIVIRPLHEKKDMHCGRIIFKFLNEAYLLDKTNSCYH
jgi:RNA ligase (TIGR02306 family)